MIKYANYIVTQQCNLNCVHCYQGSDPRPHNGTHAPYEVVVEDLAVLKENGFTHIQFSGGECTTHPELGRIVNCAKDMGFDVSIFTNGQALDEAILGILSHIFISLDGDAPVHNAIRNSPHAFDRVLKTIQKAADIGEASISIQTTLCMLNLNLYDSLAHVLEPYQDHISDIRLTKMIMIGNAKGRQDLAIPPERFQDIIQFKEKLLEHFHYHITVCDNLYSKKQLKQLCLPQNRMFSFWIDGISRKYYIFADTPLTSGYMPSFSMNKVERFNREIKKKFALVMENLSSDKLIALDDVVYF